MAFSGALVGLLASDTKDKLNLTTFRRLVI